MKIMLAQMEKRSVSKLFPDYSDGRLLDNIEALREMIAESEEIDAITTEREDADFLDSLEED